MAFWTTGKIPHTPWNIPHDTQARVLFSGSLLSIGGFWEYGVCSRGLKWLFSQIGVIWWALLTGFARLVTCTIAPGSIMSWQDVWASCPFSLEGLNIGTKGLFRWQNYGLIHMLLRCLRGTFIAKPWLSCIGIWYTFRISIYQPILESTEIKVVVFFQGISSYRTPLAKIRSLFHENNEMPPSK